MLRHHGIYHRVRKELNSSSSQLLQLSLALNGLVVVWLVAKSVLFVDNNKLPWSSASSGCINCNTRETTVQWHGGHPASSKAGSCWCGAEDKHCRCTPNLAIDLVISSGPEHDLWLVRRKDTGQLATMGGFVNVGESVEAAVKRELMEEMGITLDHEPVLFGLYSDPRRDNRRHTVSAVYSVHLSHENLKPKAGDDAKEVKRISIHDIEKNDYFADHKTILMDFRRSVVATVLKNSPSTSDGDFAVDIARSVCSR